MPGSQTMQLGEGKVVWQAHGSNLLIMPCGLEKFSAPVSLVKTGRAPSSGSLLRLRQVMSPGVIMFTKKRSQ